MLRPFVLALSSAALISSTAAAQAVEPGAPDDRGPVRSLMAPGDLVATVDTFAVSAAFRRDLGAGLLSGYVRTDPFGIGGRRPAGRTVESGPAGGDLPARVAGILIRGLARGARDLELECCRPDPLPEAARDLLFLTARGVLIELAAEHK
jgi:hypothetical protein